ncbi:MULTISPECIES: NADH:flavin oxidoreductase [Nocardia]|uniref:NADH:flavin oxidoreductase n=1 Tax=Nocardia TaxID=1817 RepID=UPI0007E986EE|nr:MULTISPECIES: NADH:flavin oxidoreductase [Nocardia]OBF66902.1 NADH:flavin oxidoreductase [Mycobacterium sp. 852002-51759_SCH5129042]MBF6277961.1 NADH:flavin oxidoreductase [Nocardia nova]OBA55447.1 NADH:flavin oxidoreductase [Nocardia sp. 852002-51101_SCH5132738]OBB49714.1 NADH:flavin oxidoreductase [Nocardia sp. 852002-51244_SCH5132740]PPJ06637.1 NADH:flavin oxidoreductase [Nocardia nova]
MTANSIPDVLAPARLGSVTLRNRTIKSATFEHMAPGALVSDQLIEFHRQVAAGGVGMTTVAYCAVAPEGRTEADQLWMRDEAIPGLRRLTDAVHAEGAAASAQIGHAGPVANAKSNGYPALSASRRISPMGPQLTHAATLADIARIRTAHGTATRLAIESGFDAVEIHFGHNYFASSFLSPALNRRKDSYGGSLRNRARLVREVAAEVREAAGDRIAVLAKLNMDDGVPGGFWLDEAIQVAQWLEADGSLDAIELTIGSSLLNPMYLFKGEAPLNEFAAVMSPLMRFGVKVAGKFFLHDYPYEDLFMLDAARQIRANVSMPLVLLGGITDKAAMDTAMAEGFEFVAMARALLREPDLINRIAKDNQTKSLCIHCNKCMPTIFYDTHCVLAVPQSAAR